MPADLVERLEAWRRNDLHLGQWEVEESRRVLRQRREVYRQFANTLSTAYSRVVLEKFDLRDATKRGDAEEGTRDQRKQNYGRFVACVSDLRQRIHNACGRRGADIAEVPAEWTTTDCHCCQHRNTWDQAAKLRYTCEQCGAEWDQDENAAHNLLARAPAVTPVEEGAREGQDSGKKVLSRRQQRFRGMLEEQQARRLQSADGGE
jgi:transposase